MELIVNKDGKVEGPGLLKKAKAKLSKDNDVTIQFNLRALSETVAAKLWRDNTWLQKYAYAKLFAMENGEYKMEFSNEKE